MEEIGFSRKPRICWNIAFECFSSSKSIRDSIVSSADNQSRKAKTDFRRVFQKFFQLSYFNFQQDILPLTHSSISYSLPNSIKDNNKHINIVTMFSNHLNSFSKV